MKTNRWLIATFSLMVLGGAGSAASCSSSSGASSGSPDAGAGGSTVDGGGGGSDGGAPMTVTLRFKATVGDMPFACGTTYTAGKTATSVRPRDFRFYVQSVRLIDDHDEEVPVALDDRSPWQTKDVALLDFEDGSAECADGNPDMNSVVTGTVPAGAYKGIVFVNGVPEALNHVDPLQAPAPLQAGAMTWGWLYGFKFVKAELGATAAPVGDAGVGLGLLHVGSVGCDNSVDGGDPDFNQPPTVSCSQPNRNEVRLDGFDPAKSTIVADVGAIFAQTDLSLDQQCHSADAPCPPMFAAVGLDATTGAKLPTQAVYHVQ